VIAEDRLVQLGVLAIPEAGRKPLYLLLLYGPSQLAQEFCVFFEASSFCAVLAAPVGVLPAGFSFLAPGWLEFR
jgi:hypothetical protein